MAVEDTELIDVLEVQPREGYRIWLRFADGVSGEVDLSPLAGQGAFKAWDNLKFFKGVYITPRIGAIAWSDEIELWPENLYLVLTGQSDNLLPKKPETNLVRVVEVEAREGYRIWLRYANGASGEVDLSYLAGRGVFKAWDDLDFFKGVYILPDFGGIAWSEEIDLCADALYLKLTGMSVDELIPSLRGKAVDA